MELKKYFDNAKGLGVFSTADVEGRVGAAVYSRPHVMEDGTIAFIMRDRLTHHNLKSNPHATFLFKEDGSGYNGMRLYLTKVKEEKNTERLEALRRRRKDYDEEEVRFLVYFRIDKSLPLIGSEA